MSSELLKVVLPAVLALLGTLVGLWLGQRRWSSEQRMQKRRAFDAKRNAAYEELWNTVEGSHIALRSNAPDESQLLELEKKINAFRLRNALFLSVQDSELASQYFSEIVALAKLVRDSGLPLVQRQWDSTVVGRPAPTQGQDPQVGLDLEMADYRVSRTRERLIERIQSVMLETSYAVSKPA